MAKLSSDASVLSTTEQWDKILYITPYKLRKSYLGANGETNKQHIFQLSSFLASPCMFKCTVVFTTSCYYLSLKSRQWKQKNTTPVSLSHLKINYSNCLILSNIWGSYFCDCLMNVLTVGFSNWVPNKCHTLLSIMSVQFHLVYVFFFFLLSCS